MPRPAPPRAPPCQLQESGAPLLVSNPITQHSQTHPHNNILIVQSFQARKSAFRLRGKSARSVDGESTGSPSECGEFLHIGPALAGQATNANTRKSLGPRAHSTLGNFVLKNASKLDHLNGHVVPLQALTEGPLQSGGQILKDKEKFIDRINLDRYVSMQIALCNDEQNIFSKSSNFYV